MDFPFSSLPVFVGPNYWKTVNFGPVTRRHWLKMLTGFWTKKTSFEKNCQSSNCTLLSLFIITDCKCKTIWFRFFNDILFIQFFQSKFKSKQNSSHASFGWNFVEKQFVKKEIFHWKAAYVFPSQFYISKFKSIHATIFWNLKIGFSGKFKLNEHKEKTPKYFFYLDVVK